MALSYGACGSVVTYGIVTVLAPFFILQSAFGLRLAASKTSNLPRLLQKAIPLNPLHAKYVDKVCYWCRSHSHALIELLYANGQPTNIFDAVGNKEEVSDPPIEGGALYPFMLFLSRVA